MSTSLLKKLTLLALLSGVAFAQEDDADVPAKFRNLINKETYFQLRGDHLNLLRGLPADPSLRQAAIQQMQGQQGQGNSSLSSFLPVTNPWTAIGPSPIPNGQVTGGLAVSGRATSFVIDPTNTNKIYMGTAQGGVYRSTNGGTNWTQIFDGANSSAIGALALAPSNTSILFVGTGEANYSGDSYAGVGVYRIDNCDTVATLVGPINPIRNYTSGTNTPISNPAFNGRSISSILVHPTNPSIVYVGVASGIIGSGGDLPLGGTIPPLGMRGLYRLTSATSAPASVVVQKVAVCTAASGFDLPNTCNRNIDSMVYDPGDPNILTVWVNGTTAAGDGGIYRSTNAQAATPTFTQVVTTATTSARGILVIYKEGANPAVLYAATGESTNGRIRRSVDAGATWSGALAGGGGFCGGQCFYNIGIDVLPGATIATTDDIVVLGGNTPGASTLLFGKSTNGAAKTRG